MKIWFFLGALAAVLVTHPALAAAVLGVVGTLAAIAAAQPVVWAFAAGLIARPRIDRRLPRSLR